MQKIVTVVLSGGAGSRLWPASREGHPKPFLTLADGSTLIGRTYERALAMGCDLLTVTNRDYYFISQDALTQAGGNGSFLLEPTGRNTAPAIALAAHWVSQQHGADTLMLVLPADHLIADTAGFKEAVRHARQLAGSGYLVTFGITPNAPETGFGYIERGAPLEGGYQVNRFVEKPDLATAQTYLASGQYLWNAGMFCFKAGVFLEALKQQAPDLAQAVTACWQAMQPLTGEATTEIPADLFAAVPDISVDYAVMERSDRVAVVPGDFGWSDIGSWSALRDLVAADADGNRAIGEALFVDTGNTFVQASGRLVATLGVQDLLIVDTPDALLVADAASAQDVKQVVARLKEQKHESAVLHRTVSRPWGRYTVLEEQPGFKIKRIEVKPGASLSLQMHHHRSEHWVVVSGTAKITNGDVVTLLQANESSYIPAGQRHRLENPGVIPCVMVEVQCGPYLGEDDIVRFDDRYGR